MSTPEAAPADQSFGLMRAISKVGRKQTAAGQKAQLRMAGRTAPAREDSPAKAESACTASHPQQDGIERWPLPGLAPMTRVRTNFGDVHAVALRKGDQVLTRAGEYKPIVWVNRIMLDEHILNLKPDSNPISIAPGALGPSAPGQEILVSPRQVVVADEASSLSSAREAAMLISRPGVRRLYETGLSYTMFHVGEAADIYCEGLYLHFPLDS